jgi:hypothetical protein
LSRGAALWLPLPLAALRLTAWLAEAVPQKVLCRDTIALLERGSVPALNAAPLLLGRAPGTLAQGLAVSAPQPLLDLRVDISPPIAGALRLALATMWIYTALISLLWPAESGVRVLLAHCGLNGAWGNAALGFTCLLNIGLGVLVWRRPGPWTYALQATAVLAYTLSAALAMPSLVVDHCGPLVKNLPVLGVIMVLWLSGTPAVKSAPSGRATAQPSLAAL